MYDLLTDPIVSARSSRGTASLSLPELLSALADDAVESFPALRPHQRPAWHAFLVQVAALALHRAALSNVPTDAETWRRGLVQLGGEASNRAWSLVVDDWTKPALLQAPVPDPALAAQYKTEIETPDALDLLVTSRNHDLKAARLAHSTPELWLFALVTLQTFEGVMGAGKYGISRMNSGYGSRPMLGIEPPGGLGARFKRDVMRLMASRSEIASRVPGLGRRRQVGLVWLEPWDGKTQLTIEELDPFYVEICRRVRLRFHNGRIAAAGTGSRAPRIDLPKQMKGITGDPWAPIDRAEGKVFSISARKSFGYQQMVSLLDPTAYDLPPLARIDQADAAQGLVLEAAALARGQGKTEGFHQRRIPISKEIGSLLVQKKASDELAALGRARVGLAGEFASKVLRPALFMLFQGGAADFGKQTTSSQVDPWLRAFDHEVDQIFFDLLFSAFAAREAGDEERLHREERIWQQEIHRIGRSVLLRATASAPRTASRWHRARALSQSYFEARAAQVLPLIKENVHEPAAT